MTPYGIPTPTRGPFTRLPADVLEYILLGLALAYTIVAFYEWRAGRNTGKVTLRGKILGYILLGLPMIESFFRKLRKPKAPPPTPPSDHSQAP